MNNMKNFSWKQVYPHLIAIGIFLVVALIYCRPAIEGRVLQQSDNIQWQAMSKDAFNYKEKHGVFPLWINNMFSGMPSFQVAATYNNLLPYYVTSLLSLYLPKPLNFFFLACLCFYFLMQVLRVNRVVSIMGALAFAYATYNPIIIAAGHDSKMMTIAFMPAMLGGLLLIYEKRYWLGASFTALSTAVLVAANHQQIAFYMILTAVAVTISYTLLWIKHKEIKQLITAGIFTILAGAIGVLVNASILFSTYDFSKATIRGGSALSSDISSKDQAGLSKEYAFSYSMYKTEPLVMMFPQLYGGSDNPDEKSAESSKAMEALQSMPQELQGQAQGFYRFYWGGVGFTSGPPYVGAIICFLAILGMFILDNRHKWWIAGITLLAVVMSWGGFFPSFNGWLLQHLPFYNKFRAPSMTLVIPQLVLPVLACLSLDKILTYDTLRDKTTFTKKFRNGLIAVGAFILIALMVYVGADFYSDKDLEVLKQVRNIPQTQVKEPLLAFFTGLKQDRQSLMLGTIFRTLFLSAIGAALIYFFFKGKLKPLVLTIVFAVLAFGDVMAVDLKYLNTDAYQDKEEYDTNNFTATTADKAILQDKGFYRVFNTTRDPFNDAMTSYFHHSVGGYNPAKLSIYQDLIEKQLAKSPVNLAVFNMLNTKYFIVGNPGNPQVQQNPDALGNAWFVKEVKWVNGAAEEMAALDHFSPRDTAVVDKQYQPLVHFDAGKANSAAVIQLVNNDNDYIEYSSSNASNGFGVFSEVYYNRGWKAFIDGKETPIAKVNYVLRGLSVPAGKHKIEFKFEPAAHVTGSRITAICQILLVLLFAGGLFADWRNRKKTAAA